MIRLPFTRRCESVNRHRRRDTDETIRVQCERERGHAGEHYWGPDAWLLRNEVVRYDRHA